MVDGSLGAIGKAAGLIVSPVFRRVRQELARRNAHEAALTNPVSIASEFDEAIGLLLGEHQSLSADLLARIKAVLSDLPDLLKDPAARDWLRRDDVQELIKNAAIDLIIEAPLDEHISKARELYGISSDEADWLGEPLFESAVSFLALTINSKIDAGTRLVIVAATRQVFHQRVILERILAEYFPNNAHRLLPQETLSPLAEGWHPLSFGTSRGILHALMGQALGPSDVAACPRLLETDALVKQLETLGVARLVGVPGAGKTISILQVAQVFADRGWQVFRLDDSGKPVPDLVGANLPTLHIIDDAHLVDAARIRRLEESCGEKRYLLTAYTNVSVHSAARGSLHLDAKRAVRTIASGLRQDLPATLEAVCQLDDQIGTSMFDESLEARLTSAADQADYPWQFCFILSGGWRRARDFASSSRAANADLVLAALALRQIATRDAQCSLEDAHRLLSGVSEGKACDAAINWLRTERLVLSSDDLRCPHQRFAVVMFSEIADGSDNNRRSELAKLISRLFSDPAMPLAGLASLLHQLRFGCSGHGFQGLSYLVDPRLLDSCLERCWCASGPEEIRDAALFLNEIGAVHRHETAVFAANAGRIVEWVRQNPQGAGYALGDIGNHIFNIDEPLGRQIRAAVDLGDFARSIDPNDAIRTAEVINLASKTRMHWEEPDREKFMQGLDREGMVRLMSSWPRDVPLYYGAKILEFMLLAEEPFGLDLAAKLASSAASVIRNDPIGTFHEIRDLLMMSLRLIDVFDMYNGDNAPSAAHRAVGQRFSEAFCGPDLSGAISRAPARRFQTCAFLLAFIEEVDRKAFRKVVEAIDWSAIGATIGESAGQKGSGLSHETVSLMGQSFSILGARPGIERIVETRLVHVAIMPSRLAIMFPDLAIRQIEEGRKVEFDGKWMIAGLLLSHFAALRPEFVGRLIAPYIADLANDLSQDDPSFYEEPLITLAVLCDVAPEAFESVVAGIAIERAELGWREALRRSNRRSTDPKLRRQARETVAFLIEKTIARNDAIGDLARQLRKAYPRASLPSGDAMVVPEAYPRLVHPGD